MPFTQLLSSVSDGSMRFRWNEVNTNRIRYFNERGIGQPVFDASGTGALSHDYDRTLVSIELIHSHSVYDLSCGSNGHILVVDEHGKNVPLQGLQGDGYITKDPRLVPCVTVADCMPLWFSDDETGVFGVVHSGWKGTGIIVDALKMAERIYGTRREHVRITIGPHIHNCCYNVDPERVTFFSEKFGENCITRRDGKSFLSLQQANLNALFAFGVAEDQITLSDQCTCCCTTGSLNISEGPDSENYLYGSFRRQTVELPPEMPFEEKSRRFTVMAAAALAE